jgi:cell division septation protein DedD
MDGMGAMRDLDQIQEREEGSDPARTVVLAVGGLAAACVLFAAGVLIGRDQDTPRQQRREDPLARLDALAAQSARAPAATLSYPSQLAMRNGAQPTTGAEGASGPALSTGSARVTEGAVANLQGSAGSAAQGSAADHAASAQQNAAPNVAATARANAASATSVPAGALLDAQGGVRASLVPARIPVPVGQSARLTSPTIDQPASVGSDGAFNLQVSSFRALAGAQTFAQRLRERGHRAYVASGTATTGTGTWHRVRIGPFASMREVTHYRAEFESRERLPSFIVRRDNTEH